MERATGPTFTVVPEVLRLQFEDTPGEQDNWEIGGDYEKIFDSGDRFKVLFVMNQNNRDSTRERFDILDGGSREKNLFLQNSSVTEEEIVRGSYTMDIFSGQNVEFGAERAVTTLGFKSGVGRIGP